MSVVKYEAFLKVIELHSISAAAAEMGYTQSAVSKMINELEKEWKVKLIVRNHDGARVTSEGKVLLEDIRRLVRAEEVLDYAVASLHGMNSGIIRLGAPISVSSNILPAVLRKFHDIYPNIRVELYEGEDAELSDYLKKGVTDVCILPKPVSDKYKSVPLFTDSLVAVLPKGHPYSSDDFFPVKAFESEEVISLRERTDYDMRRFFDENRIRPNVVYEVSDDNIMLSMVENGLGICVDYELVLKPLRYDVVVRPLSRTKKRTLALCVKDEEAETPLIKLFSDFTAREARALWDRKDEESED